MKIKNLKELATTPARKAALEIAEAGLEAIDTGTVLKRALNMNGDKITVIDIAGKNHEFSLSPKGKLIAVLAGKCAADGAVLFEEILDGKLSSGIALGVGNAKRKLSKVQYHAGTHPMPSNTNLTGTRAILNSLSGLTADDTVIFLISGGGSTLLVQPPCVAEHAADLVVKEKGMLGSLFKAGATIQEINTLRKHMSLARGGFLAQAAHPAQVISIIFSDVPGDDLESISSGPTIKDDTTVKDAETVMKKYGLDLDHECLTETPKDDEYFKRVDNILTLSNETAVAAMKSAAESLGYAAIVKSECLVGEAREIGASIAREANQASAGTAILYCGETTVTIHGKAGKGGRNQEVTMGALPELKEGRVVLSIASDGHDNGEHAGALADAGLADAAKAKGLKPDEFMANNDSSTFFENVGDGLIETGLTGSNVSDLMIAVVGK